MGISDLRKGRYSHKDYIYFVTLCCDKRQELFTEQKSVYMVVQSIQWLGENRSIDLYFYVIMPDHIHLVFQLIGEKTLSEIIKSLKQFSSKQIRKSKNISVWQKGFYDHCVRKEESVEEIVKYCWYNPVRAGLVTDPKKYPYWWCKWDLKII